MRPGAALTAAVVALALGAAACSGGGDAGGNARSTTSSAPGPSAPSASGKVGVILPDTTATRWESADRRYLAEAFEAAGVEYEIGNAEGDRTKMAALAEGMIADGAKVLVIANLDSESGSAIQKQATAAGVTTVDYDRLTRGGTAAAYVTFDDRQVGELMVDGLARCLEERGTQKPAVAVLGRSNGDDAAERVAQSYGEAIKAKTDAGEWTLAGEQAVPEGEAGQATQAFERLLDQASGPVGGVLAADDDLADAAISVLKARNLDVPVVGQGASVRGLQHVLAGDQCMTVLRPVEAEATAAAATAVALLAGNAPAASGTVDNGVSQVPLVLAPTSAVFRGDVARLVADGTVAREELCAADAARLCADAGIG